MAAADAPALYQRIAEQLAQLIHNGALARQHGVAQATVVQAYHWLEDARLVAARPRSGFFVAAQPVRLPEPSTPRALLRPREVSVDWLGQRILGHQQPADMVSFSSGTPGPDLLKPDRVRRAVTRAAQRHRQLLCCYPAPSEHEEARRALARHAVGLGCSLDPENIVITGGCMDGIALCLRAVTEPGDVVALESPMHFSFLEILQGLHLRALEIPTHPRNGLSLDALQLALDTQPLKALILVPTLSNPLGSCMPQAARKRLAQMAARHGLAVIEDAIYSDLAALDEMRRSVKSYDASGHVMLCESFSKTLAPGLARCRRWADKLLRIKDLQMGGQSPVLELALADLITQAGHAAAMRQLRSAVAARIDEVRRIVAAHFPPGTRVSDPPGGLLLWLELPRALDAVQLHQRCLAQQILVAPGAVFSASGRFRNCLRIGIGGDWSPAHLSALRTVAALACKMLR